MQKYFEISIRNQPKIKQYLINSNDIIDYEFKVDNISPKTLSILLSKNLATPTTFGVKLNVTALELQGLIINEEIGFKIGIEGDITDIHNDSDFNLFMELLKNGYYEESFISNQRYYLNNDNIIEKVFIKEVIDNSVCKLQNKEGFYSLSLLFYTNIQLKINLCIKYLNMIESIDTKTFNLYLKDIFTPSNIILYADDILNLIRKPHRKIEKENHNFDITLKNNENLQLHDYSILTMDVLFRLHNYYDQNNNKNDFYFSCYMYSRNSVKENIIDLYKPVNFHYMSIKEKTGIDVCKWYLDNNIKVSLSSI